MPDARRPEKPPVHGSTCEKVPHLAVGGYLHGTGADGPYDVDGVTYCGRCHVCLIEEFPEHETIGDM